MRRVADRLVRLIARAATFGWFRAVEVTGLERTRAARWASRIVPIGLIYEDKQRARSRAFVRVGDPLELDSDLATNPAFPRTKPTVPRSRS